MAANYRDQYPAVVIRNFTPDPCTLQNICYNICPAYVSQFIVAEFTGSPYGYLQISFANFEARQMFCQYFVEKAPELILGTFYVRENRFRTDDPRFFMSNMNMNYPSSFENQQKGGTNIRRTSNGNLEVSRYKSTGETNGRSNSWEYEGGNKSIADRRLANKMHCGEITAAVATASKRIYGKSAQPIAQTGSPRRQNCNENIESISVKNDTEITASGAEFESPNGDKIYQSKVDDYTSSEKDDIPKDNYEEAGDITDGKCEEENSKKLNKVDGTISKAVPVNIAESKIDIITIGTSNDSIETRNNLHEASDPTKITFRVNSNTFSHIRKNIGFVSKDKRPIYEGSSGIQLDMSHTVLKESRRKIKQEISKEKISKGPVFRAMTRRQTEDLFIPRRKEEGEMKICEREEYQCVLANFIQEMKLPIYPENGETRDINGDFDLSNLLSVDEQCFLIGEKINLTVSQFKQVAILMSLYKERLRSPWFQYSLGKIVAFHNKCTNESSSILEFMEQMFQLTIMVNPNKEGPVILEEKSPQFPLSHYCGLTKGSFLSLLKKQDVDKTTYTKLQATQQELELSSKTPIHIQPSQAPKPEPRQQTLALKQSKEINLPTLRPKKEDIFRIADILSIDSDKNAMEVDIFGLEGIDRVSLDKIDGYSDDWRKQKITDFVSIENKLTIKMEKIVSGNKICYEVKKVFVQDKDFLASDEEIETTKKVRFNLPKQTHMEDDGDVLTEDELTDISTTTYSSPDTQIVCLGDENETTLRQSKTPEQYEDVYNGVDDIMPEDDCAEISSATYSSSGNTIVCLVEDENKTTLKQRKQKNEVLENELEEYITQELQKKKGTYEFNKQKARMMARTWRFSGEAFLEDYSQDSLICYLNKQGTSIQEDQESLEYLAYLSKYQNSVDGKKQYNIILNDLKKYFYSPTKKFSKGHCIELTTKFLLDQLRKAVKETADLKVKTSPVEKANITSSKVTTSTNQRVKLNSSSVSMPEQFKEGDSENQEVFNITSNPSEFEFASSSNSSNYHSPISTSPLLEMEMEFFNFLASQTENLSIQEFQLMCARNSVTLHELWQWYVGWKKNEIDIPKFTSLLKGYMPNTKEETIRKFAPTIFTFFMQWESPAKKLDCANLRYRNPPGVPSKPVGQLTEANNLLQFQDVSDELVEDNQMAVSDDEADLTIKEVPNLLNKIRKCLNFTKDQENYEDVVNLERQISKLEEIQQNLSFGTGNTENNFVIPVDINEENQQSFDDWKHSIQKRIENLEKEKQYKPSRTQVRIISETNNEEILVHTDLEGRLPEERIRSLYSDISAIKFKNTEDSSSWKHILHENGFFYPPEDGWKERLYLCIKPKGFTREVVSNAKFSNNAEMNQEQEYQNMIENTNAMSLNSNQQWAPGLEPPQVRINLRNYNLELQHQMMMRNAQAGMWPLPGGHNMLPRENAPQLQGHAIFSFLP